MEPRILSPNEVRALVMGVAGVIRCFFDHDAKKHTVTVSVALSPDVGPDTTLDEIRDLLEKHRPPTIRFLVRLADIIGPRSC